MPSGHDAAPNGLSETFYRLRAAPPPALRMKAFCPVPLVHAEILVEVIRERVRGDESQPMRS